MKMPHYAFLSLLLAFTTYAADVPDAGHYIDPASVDLKKILADPPADGSVETKQEMEDILEKQKNRTPAEVARAVSEVKLTPYAFADVVGPWFKPQNLPLTDALLKKVEKDTHDVTESAKKFWDRPRPPLQDPRIQPAIELPQNAAYPSGHATRGIVFATILGELAPDLKEALLARGREIGEDRVLGGVHFPSDVAAGRILGQTLAARFLASPSFQADLIKAKAEFSQVRAGK